MSVVAIRAFTETTGKKWTVESAEVTPTREHFYDRSNVTIIFKTPTLLKMTGFTNKLVSIRNTVLVSELMISTKKLNFKKKNFMCI